MLRILFSQRNWAPCAAMVCVLSVGLAAAAQTSTQQDASPQGTNAPSSQQTSQPSGSQTPANSQALPDAPGAAPNLQPAVEPEGPTAVLDTSMGRIVCKLYSKESPITVANFIGLATGSKEWTDPATHKKIDGKRFYDGTTFHRVIPGFMIQGGDPTGTGTGDPGYLFQDELDPTLNFEQTGMLAMANSGPNTNGSQFFITDAPYPSLDQHYTIFGKCDDPSVLVVESITEVERDDHDKPLQPVYLNKVTIVENGQQLPPVPAPAAAPAQTAPTPTLTKRY